MTPVSMPGVRSHVTLVLCTILHAFTHAYGTLLVPLYILMQHDLALKGVGYASFIVTINGFVYCLGSYGAGILADRYNRKAMLGIGLLGNALTVVAMGLTHRYELLVFWGVLAGIFGTLFHPAANALVPAHYPKNPGMAIGLLGIGSGIGFFAGPQFAGWRAQTASWNISFAHVSNWQRPLIESGLAGLVIGIIFLFVAKEVKDRHPRRAYDSIANPSGNGDHLPRTPVSEPREDPDADARLPRTRPHRLTPGQLGRRIATLAPVLGCRDFAGVATISIASIYLQKAHGLSAARTGFILGSMMLLSIVVSPIAVWLSPGRRRLPTLGVVLTTAGFIVMATPFVAVSHVLAVLMLFMTFQLGSYAVSDAAILERVEPHVRGRVVGLFLTLAGTFASTSPFVMGFWTDRLRERASQPAAYIPIFITLGCMMIFSALSLPLIKRLGPPLAGAQIDPITETTPATVEPAL